MELQPHQQRVVTERDDLTERLIRLYTFFQSPTFAGLPEAEQSRLRNQARFMDGYEAILVERIAAFPPPKAPVTPGLALDSGEFIPADQIPHHPV